MTKTTTTTLTTKQQELINAQKGKKVSFAKMDETKACEFLTEYKQLVKEFATDGVDLVDSTVLRPKLIWPADPAWDMDFQRMQRKVQIAEKRQELYRIVEYRMREIEATFFGE